jgi:ABC-type multidrug transport system ATPase subunit
LLNSSSTTSRSSTTTSSWCSRAFPSTCRKAASFRLLGGNGAGKTTTLRAVSNLLHGERGEVTKGSIELKGERVEAS